MNNNLTNKAVIGSFIVVFGLVIFQLVNTTIGVFLMGLGFGYAVEWNTEKKLD